MERHEYCKLSRNGSDQATRQWVWGTQYVDEPLFMDVNSEPTVGNDCDPDVLTTSEELGGSGDDRRFYYQQDRQPLTPRPPRSGVDRPAIGEQSSHRGVKGNWNVIALTETDDDHG
ncbi:MAG: hypothetical protein ABIG44_00900, partial [Planctomycetota bacterium]